MLRRALDLVKKIYSRRGSTLLLVAGEDSVDFLGTFREAADAATRQAANPDHLPRSSSNDGAPEGPRRPQSQEHLVDPEIHLDGEALETKTGPSQSRHASHGVLVGGAKVLAGLSRGGL
jgi:hypothetical protein